MVERKAVAEFLKLWAREALDRWWMVTYGPGSRNYDQLNPVQFVRQVSGHAENASMLYTLPYRAFRERTKPLLHDMYAR